jgi:alkylated DNA repair dioxygenase AlkB
MKFILLRSRPRHRAHWPAAARRRRPFARPALPEQGTAMSVAMLLAWGWDARADPTRRSKLRSPRRPDPRQARPRRSSTASCRSNATGKKAPAGGGDRQALPARTLVRS